MASFRAAVELLGAVAVRGQGPRLTSTPPVSVHAVLTRGSLDERKWELLRKKGAASDLAFDGQLTGEQERPIDWNKVLRDLRAAGVRATGDERDEHDVQA